MFSEKLDIKDAHERFEQNWFMETLKRLLLLIINEQIMFKCPEFRLKFHLSFNLANNYT